MKELLKIKYNISNPRITKLVGYNTDNYKIESKNQKYILKSYTAENEIIDFVSAENEILLHLQKEKNNIFPQPIQNTNGQFLSFSENKNSNQAFRLLTFIEGSFLAETLHSVALFKSFGKFLAAMDVKLLDVKNYTIQSHTHKWDLQHFTLNKPLTKYISEPADRKLVDYFFLQYQENVRPHLYSLRKSIIHNDANDWNVLMQNENISGIIDFGDCSYTHLINELAIAITYAIMGKKNPVEWAKPIIAGYHNVLPLEKKETDLLYWLIAARLCTSVCNSAYEKIKQPNNKYICISEQPIWELLRNWATINPVYARNEFRKAAGYAAPIEKSVNEIKQERFQSISPVFSISYKKPIYMERAVFQYMFDKYGNSYLDAYNNIPHVGHSHPRVVNAGQKQLAKLNTNTRYLYEQISEYASHLLNFFPAPLNKVFLVNSGSAATDLALRLARNFTGKRKVAVLEHGYHGNTQAAIEISHYKFSGKGGNGVSKNILCLPLPDTFRGEFKLNNGRAGFSYAQKAIQQIQQSNEPIAAFIAEPIVGCGGQVPLAKGYLSKIYKEIRHHGGVCISDEVQTGFGRLGDVFWGFEAQDVVPDIVILGKPMGNGHPMGAVVTSDEIANAFNNGMEFFSSFGGNPVSCAIGQAVLQVLEEEDLQQNAKTVGNYYMKCISELQQTNECIGDVRGSGLFIGIELVKNRMTLEPHTQLAQKVKNELREQFVLVSTDGPFNNVIKSKPPLCFTKANVDEVIEKMHSLLS